MVDFHHRKISDDECYKDTSHNFPILDNKFFDFFDDLYETFYQKSIELFGNLTLSKENSRICWAQVSNKNNIGGPLLLHNHLDSSTINGVFYLSVPEKNSGKIIFCDDVGNIILSHQPSEGSLLIFPNYLNHYPEVCDSELFRIAINMEILCEEQVWND